VNLTLADIAEILGNALSADDDRVVRGVSIDTRTLRPGDVFFALSGSRSDGHAFVHEAFERGAAAAVVEVTWNPGNPQLDGKPLFRVPDPLGALQRLAARYREGVSFPVLAVTGTNGKTTTKDMIAAVLGSRFRCAKTEGNLNNHIGVPMSVCAWDQSLEIAVLEMGANHSGEIRELCRIAKPTHGVITNIGKGHLEFFGDEDGVLRAKSELLEALPPGGIAFLNGDDERLARVRSLAANTVLFGFSGECHVRGESVKEDPAGCSMTVEGRRIRIPLPGKYNLSNALAAVAVGRAFGVSWDDLESSLGRAGAAAQRSERLVAGGVRILNDTYNANPSSVEQAVLAWRTAPQLKHRAVVLGDMLELGDHGPEEHRRIGKAVADARPNAFFAIGEGMRLAAEAARAEGMRNVHHFTSKNELVQALVAWAREGDGVLVKGSRGMRMEEIVDGLVRGLGTVGQE
jgi:UDP-N-acetylmuramoyl-tripeptide--D-alanyl-D-alanine ligase